MPIRMSGLASQMDTESIVKELMSAQRMKQTKVENKKTKLEWKQDKWKTLNTKIYKLYTDSVSKMRIEGSYLSKKATSSDDKIATATASTSGASGTHTLEVQQLASSEYVTGKEMANITSSKKLKDIDPSLLGKDITVKAGSNASVKLSITADTTVTEFLNTLQNAGLNATFDDTQHRFFISSKQSGSSNGFTITSTDNAYLGLLGLPEIVSTTDDTLNTKNGASYVSPKSAKVVLDGAELTSSSNNFSAAGITLNLLSTTTKHESIVDGNPVIKYDAISLTVTNNTQGTYDMVKSFLKDYNALLDELNDVYYADPAKGYEPLTDDEKEAMTDDQILKWENKIKDALLRRDDKLSDVISTMKTALQSSVTVDGKKYSLISYGIMTSTDYSEKGLLHIYGNSEDSTYSLKEDKLKKAIEEDPDKVATVLSGIAQNLYDTMTKKMKSTELNSALTFYNDKVMTKQIKDYKTEISDWEKRLQRMETRYYNQFTAMEKAMASLNTQQSALSSLLGK